MATVTGTSSAVVAAAAALADVAPTIPAALAAGPGLHSLVRVELTNGTRITGRLMHLDADTMNLSLGAITDTSVCIRGDAAVTTVPSPTFLNCVNSVVVRGCHIRYLDFLADEQLSCEEAERLETAGDDGDEPAAKRPRADSTASAVDVDLAVMEQTLLEGSEQRHMAEVLAALQRVRPTLAP